LHRFLDEFDIRLAEIFFCLSSISIFLLFLWWQLLRLESTQPSSLTPVVHIPGTSLATPVTTSASHQFTRN
jgi:uncharacterized membrane protein YkgB